MSTDENSLRGRCTTFRVITSHLFDAEHTTDVLGVGGWQGRSARNGRLNQAGKE